VTDFRDEEQHRAVCNRLLEFARYDQERGEYAQPSFSEPARVRRARTLFDLALAIWNGDSQLSQGMLVQLDKDTRTMVGDLLADLGAADPAHVDRWLENTHAFFGAEGGP
jgi:hypothetical protein